MWYKSNHFHFQRLPALSPELFEEVDVGAGADELDELLVGGRIGVGLLVVLVDLLTVLQLGQQHAVDVVWVAQQLHQRLQHCMTERSREKNRYDVTTPTFHTQNTLITCPCKIDRH